MLECLVLAAFTVRAAAQDAFVNRELEIQAAYLFNFGKYVSWTDAESKEFVIGILGDSPIKESLEKIAGTKSLQGKPITIHQFHAGSEFRPCQILYVPDGRNSELAAKILAQARQESTLIVGERRTAAPGQTMIHFYPDGNNLRFEIDPRRAEQAGLKISSKLLTLGKIVGN